MPSYPTCQYRVEWRCVKTTHNEDWPQVVGSKSLPHAFSGHCGSVVHVSFRWVIAQQAIDKNLFFFFGPPLVGAVGSFECRCGLGDGRCHDKVGNESNYHAYKPFDEESETNKQGQSGTGKVCAILTAIASQLDLECRASQVILPREDSHISGSME